MATARAADQVEVLATPAYGPDSACARDMVVRLRTALAGTGALFGGQSAQLTTTGPRSTAIG
ncbi:hypothetical protein ACIF8W_18135 [Streptomyces sp. NPDC085639]|uniref:hypothetical protein n=1 Tax=Streptomyces sp. NPDC085639 TaxID=3365734 RepID=UPI0037D37507